MFVLVWLFYLLTTMKYITMYGTVLNNAYLLGAFSKRLDSFFIDYNQGHNPILRNLNSDFLFFLDLEVKVV